MASRKKSRPSSAPKRKSEGSGSRSVSTPTPESPSPPTPGVSKERADLERLLARGQFKEAVKQAKMLARREPNEESRSLLQRAYFERARQLADEGLRDSARDVAASYVDTGMTDRTLWADAGALLADLGMPIPAWHVRDRLLDAGDEAGARRIHEWLADQAVIRPETFPRGAVGAVAPEGLRALRDEAEPIRTALERVSEGDDAAALELTRGVGFRSPFADWRRLIRGLIALYSGRPDEFRTEAGRLNPDRAPARIARPFEVLAPGGLLPRGEPEEFRALAEGLTLLERESRGEPILLRLERLADLVARREWRGVFRGLRELRPALAKRGDAELGPRITRVLYPALISRAADLSGPQVFDELISGLAAAADPLDIDPNWNRLKAIVTSDGFGAIGEPQGYWNAYLEDIDAIPGLSEDERRLARAMVWERVGLLWRDDIDYLLNEAPPDMRAEYDVRELKDRALAALRRASELAPELSSPIVALSRALDDWGDVRGAIAAARETLVRFPDDLGAMNYLQRALPRVGEPIEALAWMRRVAALKPLDAAGERRLASLQREAARAHAARGESDAAFRELDDLVRRRAGIAPGIEIDPPRLDALRDVRDLAARSAVAARLGRFDEANALARLAVERSGDDHPVHSRLTLFLEARLAGLPDAAARKFLLEFRDAILDVQRAGASDPEAEERAFRRCAGSLADEFFHGSAAPSVFDEAIAPIVEWLARLEARWRGFPPADPATLRKSLALLAARSVPGDLADRLIDLGYRRFPEDPVLDWMHARRSARRLMEARDARPEGAPAGLDDDDPIRRELSDVLDRLIRLLERCENSADFEEHALVDHIREWSTRVADHLDDDDEDDDGESEREREREREPERKRERGA